MPAYVAPRDTSTVSWGYFVLTVVCACVLAAGFFLAARQHFNTMDFGFKNGKLRKQVEDLQTERRRLLLAREASMSPAEIKRAARSLGFRDKGEVAMVMADARSTATAVKPALEAQVGATSRTNPRVAGTVVEKASFTEAARKPAEESGVRRTVIQKATRDEGPRMMAAMR